MTTITTIAIPTLAEPDEGPLSLAQKTILLQSGFSAHACLQSTRLSAVHVPSTSSPFGQYRHFPSSTSLNGGTGGPDDDEYDVFEGPVDAPRSSPLGIGANDSKRTADSTSIGPAIAKGSR